MSWSKQATLARRFAVRGGGERHQCQFQSLEPRRLLSAAVIGRHLFYDNSYFDQYAPGPGLADDYAIATDKQALLPGGLASFANYSSYNRGINGIMIDVANLANPAAVRVDDFQFVMGNDPDTAAWQPAPQPTGVSVRQGAGVGGSDRITLTWADGAILGTWVKVSVRATEATGLAVADEFYFGSAPGEAGDSAADALVSSADELLARLNPRSPLNPAPITFPYDYNRDGLVSAQDQAIARVHRTSPFTSLRLITAPEQPALHLRPEALAAEARLKAVKATDSPAAIYGAFNEFARTHFGAEADPLIYERYGHALQLVAAGAWEHVSENSAAVAFQTSLPAVSWIEFGATTSYGQRTAATDRAYYNHLHHITGLQTGQTYHYRIVAVDERGNRIVSEDRTINTQPIAGAIYLYQKPDGSAHVLNQPGKTYVLKENLVATGRAIDSIRDDITIDLNGFTITFGEGATTSTDVHGVEIRGGYNGATEINAQGSRVRVLNGTIRQGQSALMATNTNPHLFNAVKATGASHELAGLNIVYHASQSWGVQMNHSRGDVRIHHNVIRDTGAIITDRHGAGTRAIGWRYPVDNLDNNFKINHNLIQRTRQNGIGVAKEMSHNEIYVDSWSTNSFAIQPNSQLGIAAGTHQDNKIFATGYNPYGFGWAHESLLVKDNLIHLFGLNVHERWPENWGDVNLLAALRITNYSPGGQVRNDLHYRDNLILGFAKEGAQIEGTRFYSDNSIAGVEFTGNIVKAEALDAMTTEVAPIVTQGYFRKLDSLPIFYRDSTLISNVTLVQFGSAYGKGNNHQFERINFVRIGEREDFATFRFDGTYWSTGHGILDGNFGPGTAWNDVYWDATGSQSHYTVRWTLDLQVPAGAQVTIVDADGDVEFTGIADAEGRVSTALTHAVIRPMEWLPTDGEAGRGVRLKDEHQEFLKTPHTITVTLGGRTATRIVEMTAPRQLVIGDGDLQSLPALMQLSGIAVPPADLQNVSAQPTSTRTTSAVVPSPVISSPAPTESRAPAAQTATVLTSGGRSWTQSRSTTFRPTTARSIFAVGWPISARYPVGSETPFVMLLQKTR